MTLKERLTEIMIACVKFVACKCTPSQSNESYE